jgi:hypothetical protein
MYGKLFNYIIHINNIGGNFASDHLFLPRSHRGINRNLAGSFPGFFCISPLGRREE